MTSEGSRPGHRRQVVDRFLADRGDDLLVVAGLGSTAWDVTASGDHDANLPLWGAMGGAAMVGLGLALAQPERRVLVVTGDGEALMGLGALSTIGHMAPANLAVVVIDNGHYGETGMQTTHTNRTTGAGASTAGANSASTAAAGSASTAAAGSASTAGATGSGARTDLAAVARACGWPVAMTVPGALGPEGATRTGPAGGLAPVRLDEAVMAARHRLGPVFVVVEVSNEPVPLVLPPRDGRHLAHRFRTHLGLAPL